MLTQVCIYEQSNITFQTGDSLMVNATEMAKPFGKRPSHWLDLPSTKDFIYTLETIRKSGSLDGLTAGKSGSLIVRAEGRNGGTWFHEDLALEFARWCAPAFGIWCNDRIKEIIKGQAAPQGKAITLETLLSSPEVMLIVLRKLTETELEAAELRHRLATAEARRTNPTKPYPKNITADDIHLLRTAGQRLRDHIEPMDMIARAIFARNCGVTVGTLKNYATGNGKKAATMQRLLAAIPAPVLTSYQTAQA